MALVLRHTSTEENTFRRSIAKKNLQKNVLALYRLDFFFGTMEVLIVDEGVFRIDVRKTVEYNSACMEKGRGKTPHNIVVLR